MRRHGQSAMIAQQYVCPVLLVLLVLSPPAAPAPTAQLQKPPTAGSQSPPSEAAIKTTIRASPLPPIVGYVQGRDGRLVAAVSSRDLLRFHRRLLRPSPRWLRRHLQPAVGGRVVIGYSSALRAPPPAGELPDRVVTRAQPPPPSAEVQLEAELRARQQAEGQKVEAELRTQQQAEVQRVEAELRAQQQAEKQRVEAELRAQQQTGAGTQAPSTGQRVEAELQQRGSARPALSPIGPADDGSEALEGSGTEPLPSALVTTTLSLSITPTPVTVLPLDDLGDFAVGDDASEIPQSSTMPSEPIVADGEVSDSVVPEKPPGEADGAGSGRRAEDSAQQQDSGVLLAIANEDGGSGTADRLGSGSRPADSVPATRDVRVHGPHIAPGAAGRQPPQALLPGTAAGGGDELESGSGASANVSAVVPAEAQQVSARPLADTVRREARGHFPTVAAPPMGVAEISAVSAGCVVVAAVIILGAALVVHRTGVLKRRSILSDPPLDDTRLSYINASTEFSSSDLGDEMTNLENLDNDSFLNSLESMTDSVATQSCWSRDIRHSKL